MTGYDVYVRVTYNKECLFMTGYDVYVRVTYNKDNSNNVIFAFKMS